MYLKGVEIDGFKSFAEKIKLDFTMGITSIVGPNGSGKSNILDAILWVLGEQSYKNIRAKESSDVVFSGGKNKKARTTAQVSLYIENTERELQIDDDTVKVTRKINKKGENEYYLNDNRCRLKDINELFLDTGVGKSAYSVIGQGKVERIIGASNKEIKSIIEEAASIKKIKLRKEESLKKMARVEDEIEKINLIVNELEENRERLGKQAKKAIQFKSLEKEKNQLKKGIYSYELEENIQLLEKLGREKEELGREIQETEKELSQEVKTLEELNNKSITLNQEIGVMTNENVEIKKILDKLVNDKTLYQERIKGYKREVVIKDELKASSEEKGINEKKELESLVKEMEALESEIKGLQGDHLKFNDLISEKEEEKNKLEVEIEVQKEYIMNSEVGRLKLIAELENSEKRSQTTEKKILELKEEGALYKDNIKKLEKRAQETSKKRENLEKEIEKIDKTIEEAEEEIEKISEEINKKYNLKKEADYNLGRYKAKLENLKKLDANNEGFFKGVKEVLNGNIEGVEGAVIELLEIPEQFEKAIEVGAGGLLQDVVVRNSGIAKKCINYLKEKKGGRASFLAFDNIKTFGGKRSVKGEGKILGYGNNLVSFNEKYSKIMEFVLGNLLVVEDMDTALMVSKKKIHSGNIVTLSGELVSGSGRITGGQQLKSASSIIFERKKEIKKLTTLTNQLSSQLEKIIQEEKSLEERMESYENKLENIDDQRDSLEDRLKEARSQEKDIEHDLGKEGKKLRITEMEIKEELTYINQYTKQVATASNKKEEIEKFLEETKKKTTETRERLVEVKKEIEEINSNYSGVKVNFLNKEEKKRQLLKEIDRKKETLALLKEEIEKYKNEIVELEEREEKLEKKLIDIEKVYIEENKKYEDDFLEIKRKTQEKEETEKNEKKWITLIKGKEKTLYKKEISLNTLIENFEEINGRVVNLKVRLEDLIEVEELKLTKSIKEEKERLRKLEVRLSGFGGVNLLAIEEYEEAEKKYQFLLGQRNDLVSSKKSLLDLVREIEKTIENQFYIAYKEINKNFNQMCRELVNNSVGKLKLVDSENIAESGIDLLVKYPNKKTQSITLLSGGEKSMVAIAFIMALFMYKPSPFTFFDEIEAALDEINIKKLIGKLKEFTDKSQFILITHNKETMRRSDTLYGVTMNKALGESKVLSVKV